MENGLAFDTTFLIDLQRELRAGGEGPASALLGRETERRAYLPMVAFGEFAEGFSDSSHPMLRETAKVFELLPVDVETARRYGILARRLRAEGRLIGANDLWIAASAIRHSLPLVTANEAHFSRVDALTLVSYRP